VCISTAFKAPTFSWRNLPIHEMPMDHFATEPLPEGPVVSFCIFLSGLGASAHHVPGLSR
jgi:hypothetical protein